MFPHILIKTEKANLSAFKRLVVALKINPQKFNWPQKTCKLLKNKFLGSNWSVILMWIKQSEFFDKVFVVSFPVNSNYYNVFSLFSRVT